MADELRVSIEDGKTFSVDQISVIHNPVKFVFDFKSLTPRVDMQPKDMRMKLEHNVVTMEPHLAKDFFDTLKRNIENYEKRFGKIKKPDNVKKATKSAKKKSAKVERQDYFG